MMKKIILILTLMALAYLPLFAQTQVNTKSLQEKLQTKLNEWHKNGKFAGATLGVCLADGNCFGLATGYSDLQAKTPMKSSDLMLAGSTGKTFALAVAMQLVKEGKINLDDEVSQLRAGLASAEAERDRVKGLYEGLANAELGFQSLGRLGEAVKDRRELSAGHLEPLGAEIVLAQQ